MQAIENERVQRKVADIEARRGPLEGLKQIADDPGYLAEWQERSDPRPRRRSKLEPTTTTTGKIVAREQRSDHRRRRLFRARGQGPRARVGVTQGPDDDQDADDLEQTESRRDAPGIVPIVYLKSTVLKMSDASAIDVISRHAGSGDDQWGFLPCLRRGEPVPPSKSAELIYALNQLEEELKGADVHRPPNGPRPAQARAGIPGLADRRLAWRIR